MQTQKLKPFCLLNCWAKNRKLLMALLVYLFKLWFLILLYANWPTNNSHSEAKHFTILLSYANNLWFCPVNWLKIHLTYNQQYPSLTSENKLSHVLISWGLYNVLTVSFVFMLYIFFIFCIYFWTFLIILICFLLDLDMKKDIDTLIAEERAEIITKYDRVSVCTGMAFLTSDSSQNLL